MCGKLNPEKPREKCFHSTAQVSCSGGRGGGQCGLVWGGGVRAGELSGGF